MAPRGWRKRADASALGVLPHSLGPSPLPGGPQVCALARAGSLQNCAGIILQVDSRQCPALDVSLLRNVLKDWDVMNGKGTDTLNRVSLRS